MREARSEKILVLGIDGMDPSMTKKYIEEGKMPNTKKFMEYGAQREDLVLLGSQPTVTPPMWTSLACGCNPNVHGITCFSRHSDKGLDYKEYNLDSTNCHAEPLWNVFAEAGKKTLVWHWPGSSWPPTSDSENLYVVDGSQPAGVNMAIATIDSECILVASSEVKEAVYRRKASTDERIPCVINELEAESTNIANNRFLQDPAERMKSKAERNLILSHLDGEGGLSESPFDVVLSPLRQAFGWQIAADEAKEFTILYSGGAVRRVALLLKNEKGLYDQVAIYKNKKELQPIAVLHAGVFEEDIIDQAVKNDVAYEVNRNMRILELNEDGSYIRMWISAGMDIHNDTMFHPKELFKIVTQHAGYPQPTSIMGGSNKTLIKDVMGAQWWKSAKWQAAALNYLMQQENFEMVFSHFHNIDLQSHMTAKFLKDKGKGKLSEAEYWECYEDSYLQTDYYIGQFLHLLDKGWTIFIVSDHAVVCPEHNPPFLGDPAGINIRVMEELGFTALKHDENGNELREIDWAHTKAVAQRGNHIYLNLKGREEYGIVEPEEQYEVEEEIITALYGYHDQETDHRVIALALRNKDAVLLGMGGPECGDIIYWNAEGYNYDHCDSLSTTKGYGGTSVSPIFMAAGKGLKTHYTTDRIIRLIDVAPTIAILGGVRMPAQCEGAPIYQIFEEDV